MLYIGTGWYYQPVLMCGEALVPGGNTNRYLLLVPVVAKRLLDPFDSPSNIPVGIRPGTYATSLIPTGIFVVDQ
jgi:hypothetical protein